jgi:hypothetical protein
MPESEHEALARVERAFYHVLWLLRDYLQDLVVIGGWVPYLYARFGGDPWSGRRSLTAELDILIVPPLPARGRPRLDETLRAAGLTPSRDPGPSAVWAAALESGEMIEFLTPHTGTATQQGATVALPGHGDVGAISLSAAALLAAHATTLSVPVGQLDGRIEHVDVRVPRLGAYVINKAVTFMARRAHVDGTNPKQAKDLVYIHDVMAAGEAVRRRVASDIQDIWRTSATKSAERQAVRTGRNNLDLVLDGALGRTLLPAAASQLSVRDGGSVTDADARIRGFLTDLAELLGEIARRVTPKRQ